MNKQVKNILCVFRNPGEMKPLLDDVGDVLFPCELILAASVKEAQKLLKHNNFQAVITEFQLEDGPVKKLEPHLNHSPLIILIEPENVDTALNTLGASAYGFLIRDPHRHYLKLLPKILTRSLEQKKQYDELEKYRTRLESLVRERTTELTEMYLHLQESEANFRQIFDYTSEALVITDFKFNFIDANITLLNRFGVTKEFLSSRALIDFLAPAYHGITYERLKNLMDGLPIPDLEVEIISPFNLQNIPYEINTVPIVYNQQKVLLTVMRDITERKFLARKLFETIIQTEEEERTRLARDLHDEIGPLLSALKIFTTSFMESEDIERKDKLAKQLGGIIRDVIDSIKEISNDMSPHVLVNFGLQAALQNIVNLFSKNFRIQQQLQIGDLRFPATVESVVYRIIKELINNTVKHASATQISISLSYKDGMLCCNYQDNGIGFDMNDLQQMPNKGMGLSNIFSRIKSLEGVYQLSTNPGKGFKIEIAIRTTQL